MDWQHIEEPVEHWDSVLPDGYFIVQEDQDDSNEKPFVLYKGDFDDWYLNSGPIERIGEYETLEEAQKAAEAYAAAGP